MMLCVCFILNLTQSEFQSGRNRTVFCVLVVKLTTTKHFGILGLTRITKKHSSVVKRTLGKSHDFDCAFDYDLIGQILFDFRSHSHLTFLREVEVMTLTLVMTKVMTTTF